MWEGLLAIGAAELGKVFFEQVLKLGQAAAEDYVKDFFKGCLKDGVAATKPDVAKKAVAQALAEFWLLVTDELEDQAVSRAEIRDRYEQPFLQFVQHDQVKPILGKAFEKDCRGVDSPALAAIWQQSTCKRQPFPAMPAEFDWSRVGQEYLKKVRRIIRETPELRSLLETELFEEIARNTAQVSPGFDVGTYRQSLQSSYGHLKLYAIDSTDCSDAIKLWQMFIEQTVREALPPTRYEVPLDIRQKSEFVENSDFLAQPARKVLAAISDAQRAVILGDPGAGKSTLLQYLALDWVEGKTASLPLLIELREHAIAQSKNFLDFLHHGRGADWQFDQVLLHQYLLEQPTVVMFDGLDEVFDRASQAAVIDDIIRFAQQYPQAQILVTSRIIGYNPERFQHAEFRQFTIQPLDTAEMHEFIDRWYDLSMGSDPDKVRLKQRLKDAIANSKAIQNLADHPLLLTMMAILNQEKEQGLPQKKIDLYNQASELLLHKWDYEAKHDLKDPRWEKYPVEIDHRDKRAMLQHVARFIQTNESGLEGNFIRRDDLEKCLTSYLKASKEAQNAPSIAKLIIEQLRKRDFVICHYGSDVYGFVHRTFLEYFCAMDVVDRLEKQTLTFAHLRDEIFGRHWQDETWHEVLSLISGQIHAQFVGQLIEFLLNLDGNLLRIYLAVDCLVEVSDRSLILDVDKKLLEKVKGLTTLGGRKWVRSKAIECIAKGWSSDSEILGLLLSYVQKGEHPVVTSSLIQGIASKWKDKPEVIVYLKEFAQSHGDVWVRELSIRQLANGWHDQPDKFDVFNFLCERLAHETYGDSEGFNTLFIGGNAKAAAIQALNTYYADHPKTIELLFNSAINEPGGYIRQISLEALLKSYSTHAKTLELLRDRALNDPDEQLREWAQKQLQQMESQGGASGWT